MENNIVSLKKYIEKDLISKNIDFFSNMDIEKSFISSIFEYSDNKIAKYQNILKSLIDNDDKQNIAILGNGGQGKSQFLKMLYKDLYNKGKLPIFVSLQNFGLWQSENKAGLQEYINFLIGFDISNIKNEIISDINNDNKYKDYFLLLDGLDEYDKNVANLVNNEILSISSKIQTIVTSRYTHSIYLNTFAIYQIKKFDDIQIHKYLKLILDENEANQLNSLLNQRQDIKSLGQIPLFLAFLVRLYHNNTLIMDNIHSKSDFLSNIFYTVCDEKKLDISKRENLLKELSECAYNLKCNKNILPSEDLLKLQFIIQIDNKYQFTHKLFEDYYTSLYVANNSNYKVFLNPKYDVYNIFSNTWKQAIIFWFGLDIVSDDEKLKFFNQIRRFKDKTSKWYEKRAFLLCCEILGEYKNIHKKIKLKLLYKLVEEIKHNYSITDERELEHQKGREDSLHLLDIANVLYNTDRFLLCQILYNKLELAWKKKDIKAPITTYINHLANFKYSTKNFRDLLFDIYKEKSNQYSSDLYAKAFCNCANEDSQIIEFMIEKLENPAINNLNSDRGCFNATGIIDILAKIVEKNSIHINRLFAIYQNEEIINQYGDNSNIFLNKLKKFLHEKSSNEIILKKLGHISPSFREQLYSKIISYIINNRDDSLLTDIAEYQNSGLTPLIYDIRQAFENIDIGNQKAFLKIILLDTRFQNMQKSVLCDLANKKYQEQEYIFNLFQEVQNNENHILFPNLPCLSYIIGMISNSGQDIQNAINILSRYISEHPNDSECINWLGQISLQHKQYKNSIIDTLKSINYTKDNAKSCAYFYIDYDDPNKKSYKKCLMELVLDKNKKDKRNDNILDLYGNCLYCPDNNDLINFSIQLIKSLPLKNTLYRNIIWCIHHISFKLIFFFNNFKSKVKNKFIIKFICLIANLFVNIENTINRKYYNHRFIHLDNWFIRYINKENSTYILKKLKKENYAPILCYLAYEMDYIDYYQVYHPINTFFKRATKKLCKSVITLLVKINKHFKKFAIGTIILIIVGHLFWITIALKQENKPLTINNYIHCIVNKYTKDYK